MQATQPSLSARSPEHGSSSGGGGSSRLRASSNVPDRFQCGVCKSTYSRPDHLRRHMRIHSLERQFACKQCSRTFTRQDLLRRHMAQVHHIALGLSDATRHVRSTPLFNAISSSEKNQPDPLEPEPPAVRMERETRTIEELLSSTAAQAPPLEIIDLSASEEESPPETPAEFSIPWGDEVEKLLKSFTSFADVVSCRGDLDRWLEIQEQKESQQQPQPQPLASLRSVVLSRSPPAISSLQKQNYLPPFARTFTADACDWTPSYAPQPIHQDFLAAVKPVLPRAVPRSISISTDVFLRHIDSRPLYAAYVKHFAPYKPFLHLPTLAFDEALKLESPGCGGEKCCLHSGKPQRLRAVPPSLLFIVLATGAAYELQHALAQVLFDKAGELIRARLGKLSTVANFEPPVDLIQALMLYTTFGISFGDSRCTENMLRHLVSLGALVADAGLSDSRFTTPSHANLLGKRGTGIENAEELWLKWSVEEERRRTFWVFLWNVSAMTAYINNGSGFDTGPINLPLPASEDLWGAESASEWENLCRLRDVSPQPMMSELGNLFFTPEEASSDPPNASSHERVGEFGCLLLISVLTLIARRQCQRKQDFSGLMFGITADRTRIAAALQRWQAIWISISKSDNPLLNRHLLANCLPLLDHAQLLLHNVDLTEAKEALRIRDYERVSRAYSDIGTKQDSILARSGQRRTSLVRHEIQLRDLALYATQALEMALQYGPWWSSDELLDVPATAVSSMTHCLHVIITWLETVSANERHRVTDGGPKQDRFQDSHMVETVARLLVVCRRRLKVASEADDLDDLDVPQSKRATSFAVDLLRSHAEIFERLLAWPVFKVFARSFRVRAESIRNGEAI